MASSGGNRSRLLLVLLLVSSLFLITLDLRGVKLASSIRNGVSTVISPAENLFTKRFSPFENFTSDVRNFSQSKKKITVVAVVTAAAKGDPRDSLIPKPRPTPTVYVTPTPSPSPRE